MNSRIDPVSIPPSILNAVEKAARLMDQELRVFKDFDIQVRWRGVPLHDGTPVVVCDLKAVDDSGLSRGDDLHFLPAFFTENDETAIRKTLRERLHRFVSILSEILSEDIERTRRRLTEMATVGGE